MKSYGQACGLAKALDLVGDRWAMLIVRELMIRGACRYSDIRHGLPGIATNLLADRLRELESVGLVIRLPAAPPVATDLFCLTRQGLALEPALLLLGQWGAGFLGEAPTSEAFQPHWMVLPLRLHMKPPRDVGRVSIALSCDGEEIALEGDGGGIDVRLGSPDDPATRVAGPGQAVLALLLGKLAPNAAAAAGIEITGDQATLAAVIASPVTMREWSGSLSTAAPGS